MTEPLDRDVFDAEVAEAVARFNQTVGDIPDDPERTATIVADLCRAAVGVELGSLPDKRDQVGRLLDTVIADHGAAGIAAACKTLAELGTAAMTHHCHPTATIELNWAALLAPTEISDPASRATWTTYADTAAELLSGTMIPSQHRYDAALKDLHDRRIPILPVLLLLVAHAAARINAMAGVQADVTDAWERHQPPPETRPPMLRG